MGSPVNYTSRTFQTVMNDFNADPELADKPDWFKRAVAGGVDVASMINNAAANDSWLRTAFTRRAVVELCANIGYEVTPATTSSGTMLFYLTSDTVLPVTIDADDLAAATKGTVAVAARRFESRAGVTVSASTDVIDLSTSPISANAITTSRDYLTGEKVLVTSSGAMPDGLTSGREYYAIRMSATSIKLASSVANAFSGTALAISGGSGNLSLALRSFRVTCYQQEAKTVTLGTSDGSSAWQRFDFPDMNVIRATLVITINGIVWTRVSNLASSAAYDAHYTHFYNTDDSSYIEFGDGNFGAIPGNFDVEASYAVGGGDESNIRTLNAISVYAGGSDYISGCANATQFTGGGDAQASETAKRIAPGTLKSRDRFVTGEDGESLALGYGGLSLVAVIENEYGPLSAKVVGIATGGGNPSSGLRSSIETFLVSRSILESMDVRFVLATITSTAVTSSAKMRPGYSWSLVQPFFRLAWKLFFSEAGQEILDEYLSSGISNAIDKINAILSESFTANDYGAVSKLLDGLSVINARNFGDTIQISDAYAYIQGNVEGLDYITISAPTFPITLAVDEITTPGVFTLTEIP